MAYVTAKSIFAAIKEEGKMDENNKLVILKIFQKD